MSVTLNITNDSFQFSLPLNMIYEDKMVKNFVDYLRVKEILSVSNVNDEDIEDLSQEINKSFWKDFSRKNNL
ncbi:MAG: hypothetical protein KA885_02165 [Spirochaetes bacterium]|nr:hypothetical protein [Spirochaetota bacterium]